MPYTLPLPEYTVFLGSIGDSFASWWQQQQYSGVFILTDEHTHRHCLPVFLQKSGLSRATPLTVIKPGEAQKTLGTCEKIWQAMFDARLDRKALVINLGGGVIGDMGGFCAATFKRGIDFVQVPTTLLAMTDAAIGGKLGIDFQGLKNAVGVFRNPAAVFADPAFLHTLPPRELHSGFAEVVKHACIGDPALWARLQQLTPDGLTALSENAWLELLYASMAVKVRIVTEDPLEKGIRALLNFGHTVGHAVESYFLQTDDPLTHGEAVAIGMDCEAPDSWRATLRPFLLAHFGHRPIPEAAFPELWALMQQDKKNASGAVRMAVPGEAPFEMRVLEPGREEVEVWLRGYNGSV